MTDRQKDMIRQMRAEGYGYIRIAQELGISENTVKSFCQRKGLSAGKIKAAVPSADGSRGICPCCGAKVVQNPGRKAKKFCSDKCRNKWWSSHPEQAGRRADYAFVCACCKKPFTAYGNAGRKYCCHACYVADRFGGGADE